MNHPLQFHNTLPEGIHLLSLAEHRIKRPNLLMQVTEGLK